MQFKRALVTGGLGFIGSALVEALSADGTSVTVVDSLAQNVVPVDHFAAIGRRNVEVIPRSVAQYLAGRPSLEGYDGVIHAASLVGPAGILKYSGSIGNDIVESTGAMIEACTRRRLPLVYFSSAEVYGKSGPLREDDDIRVPARYNARIEYALAKLTCEAMVANSAWRGLRGIILRPFNLAGPRQSRAGGFVLPTFVRQGVGKMPLTVFGGGEQVRAFLGLQDLVRFFRDCLQPQMLNRPAVVNLGNPDNATTINKLAHRVVAATGGKSRIVHTDGKVVHGEGYEEAESVAKIPEITRALGLGWRPTQSLQLIIEESVAFFRANGDPCDVNARIA